MNKELLRQIATEYDQAYHTPYHPSWNAYIAESKEMFRELLKAGWRFELTSIQPYRSLEEMQMDGVTRRLKVWTGGTLAIDNRLNHTDEFGLWKLNEVCRAVHDVHGHIRLACGFDLPGEVRAWETEKEHYSKAARAAAYSEAIGQLAYYYHFGKFVPVQYNKIIPVRDGWRLLD